MKKYALLLAGLMTANVALAHDALLGFIGGAVIGSILTPRPTVVYQYPTQQYYPPGYYYPPPQPRIIYQYQAPAPIVPSYQDMCPPGTYLIQKINPYGYPETVGCR